MMGNLDGWNRFYVVAMMSTCKVCDVELMWNEIEDDPIRICSSCIDEIERQKQDGQLGREFRFYHHPVLGFTALIDGESLIWPREARYELSGMQIEI